MRITIELESQKDFDWMKPLIHSLMQQQPDIEVMNSSIPYQSRLETFLSFIDSNPIRVNQVTIPNRDARNER